MTSDQIKLLSDSGHVIANHTWNHPNLNKSSGIDWDRQITKPNLVLEKITGRKVEYFAYPHGEKNDSVIQELKKREIKLAFQLTKRQNEKEPMYTVRRLLITGNMSPSMLSKRMQGAFR
jgi:peptidoglycan/xylan/chitin deacetylase (PgdA/CDA1 family)